MEQALTISEYAIFAILIGGSILTLAVGIERAIIYSEITKFANEIVPAIKEALSSGSIDELEEFEKKYPQNIYAKLCTFIKLNYSKGEQALLHLLGGKINEEKIHLEKHLTILASLGSNAPFIGLLGTVLGIIKAFYGIGALGDDGGAVIMRGIAVALITTAAGLIIAMPAIIANNFFHRKVKIITHIMEQISETALVSYHIKKGENQ